MMTGARLLRRNVLLAGAMLIAVASAASANEARDQSGAMPVLEIWKGKREMWLKQNGRVVRKFRISLGAEPGATKIQRGDGRTPVGTYYVSDKRANSPFHRFLGISYPNIDDAERGFAEHLISADQWADILFANLRHQPPPAHTALGGRVGIHGLGGRRAEGIDWTAGCIAVSDADIDYLFRVVPVGAPVRIHD
ncbi:MAG TPA: L,D-transpeptidase [Candidatus Kryptonia bacterium]|nr:L,D-transpeptidase [Candidatus Kryptonia bacterium]